MRVKPSSVKSFCIQYYNAQGRSRRVTLGKYGRMTLDQARKTAREKLSEVDRGNDPAEERIAARGAPTVAQLASRYMAEHSEVKKKSRRVYVKIVTSLITTSCPPWVATTSMRFPASR